MPVSRSKLVSRQASAIPYPNPLQPLNFPSLLSASLSHITQPFWLCTLLVPLLDLSVCPLSSPSPFSSLFLPHLYLCFCLHLCLSPHGLVQSAGSVQSGPFQTPLSVLSLRLPINLLLSHTQERARPHHSTLVLLAWFLVSSSCLCNHYIQVVHIQVTSRQTHKIKIK